MYSLRFCEDETGRKTKRRWNNIYEESYYKRMNALYSNKTCQECIIFPICDVCSQKRLEAISTECLHMYTEKDKYRLIANCVKTVIMR